VSEIGEAFTMLTTEPGPDVAPYHNRQIVVLARDDWARWLDPTVPAEELLRPAPAGTLAVSQVHR
jgi:putative SOS response-associated peptidase YedK